MSSRPPKSRLSICREKERGEWGQVRIGEGCNDVSEVLLSKVVVALCRSCMYAQHPVELPHTPWLTPGSKLYSV